MAAAAAVAVAAATPHLAAAAAVAAGRRESHRAGWLEQKSDVLGVSDVFGPFGMIFSSWNVF